MTKHETAALYRAIDLLDKLAPGLDARRRVMLCRARDELDRLLGEEEERCWGEKLYSQGQWDWVTARYLEGYAVTELARFLGLTDNSMHYQLKKRGIPRRTEMGRPLKPCKGLPDLNKRKREFYALV